LTDPNNADFTAWLVQRLSETGIKDHVPESSLKMMCERLVGYFLKDGMFDTSCLVDWLSSDFGLDRDGILDILRELRDNSADLDVELYIVEEWDPDEDNDLDQNDDEFQQQAEPTPAQAAPEPDSTKEKISPARQSPDKSPPKESPKTAVHKMLLNEKGWEGLFTAYATKGQVPNHEHTRKILAERFELSKMEKAFFAELPQKELDAELPGWVVHVNGKALAYEFAIATAESGQDLDRADFIRAVKKLDQESGILKAKILGMLNRATRDDVPGADVLAAAGKRFRAARERLGKMYDRILNESKR